MQAFAALLLACHLVVSSQAAYSITREYSGSTFFDRWNFIDMPDLLNNGDVLYQNRNAATSEGLAVINAAGHAIIKVDNTTTVPPNIKRNSVRIESTESYGVGSVFIIDLLHMPFGCSVWPAFWTRGTGPGKWPDVGEIDIIEGVNMRTFNQMALHTSPGCTQASGAKQVGTTTIADCALNGGGPGCTVQETKRNSFGAGFAPAGGGVFAAQFDVSGVFIWFWSRPDVPASISGPSGSTSVETTDWGTPSAAYPSSSCNITQHFTPQQLILDITLCGDFATPVYNQTCGTPKNSCTADNVFGPGSPTYDNAYFEIQWLRVFSANPSTDVMNATSVGQPGSTATSITSSPNSNSNSTNTSGNGQNSARGINIISMSLVTMIACLVFAFACLL